MEKINRSAENLISFSREEKSFLDKEFGDVKTFIIRAEENIKIIGNSNKDKYKKRQMHKALLEGHYGKLEEDDFNLFMSALRKVISAYKQEKVKEEKGDENFQIPEQLDLFSH